MGNRVLTRGLVVSLFCFVVVSVFLVPTVVNAGTALIDQVRFRALSVSTDESDNLSAGGDVDVQSDLTPEIDFTHYFTDELAAELILGTSTHSVTDIGTAAGNLDLGEVSLLPPTLTAQYHVNAFESFKPYLGAGLNYTMFYDEGTGAQDIRSISYDNEFGWALQAGFDQKIEAFGDNTSLNVDVKKLFLETDVSATTNGGATTSGDVELDPWIVGVGISYRY